MAHEKVKINKAISALEDLVNMITPDHSVRKGEPYVRACSTLSILKGTTPMPQHWKESSAVES